MLVINDSNSIVYVTIWDGVLPIVTGVNPGYSALYDIVPGHTRVTLSCYNKNREMEDLCTKLLLKKRCNLRVRD